MYKPSKGKRFGAEVAFSDEMQRKYPNFEPIGLLHDDLARNFFRAIAKEMAVLKSDRPSGVSWLRLEIMVLSDDEYRDLVEEAYAAGMQAALRSGAAS